MVEPRERGAEDFEPVQRRIERHELAIDHEIAPVERADRFDHVGKPGREVLKRARPDLHLASLAASDCANPVVLLLEYPLGPLDDACR